MDNRINAWIEDINRSIDEIFNFLPEKRDFYEYQKDLKTKRAIERNIEIIGEAINRISKHKQSNLEIKNSQRIIGTRNKIAHEYNNISDEVIWTIVLKDLPKLKKEINQLRNKQ